MARVLQLRRGTNAENNLFTGAVGELTVDTDNEVLRIHDGSTVGGTTIGLYAGFVSSFAGSTVPDGWLVCDGSAISRTTYARLFAAIGTTYGAGDGSTTFNLPDYASVRSAGIPDYTNGTSITLANGTSFTAPEDGIVVISAVGLSSGAIEFVTIKDQNDVDVLPDVVGNYGALRSGNYSVASTIVDLPKGYKFYINTIVNGAFCYFYPYKGSVPPENYCIKY